MQSNPSTAVALFGSTGSIGMQALGVIERLNLHRITVLSAGSNWQGLAQQARKWRPEWVAIADEGLYAPLADAVSGLDIRIAAGPDAAAEAAAEADYYLCLNGLVGVAGLLPSYYAARRGKRIALANKESLVIAGDLLGEICAETGATIFPVDSEHSAIYQCLLGEPASTVKRLILTASGGPFREWTLSRIATATAAEALNHPTWKMGAKITIDSATLMNKGFEVIEAHHLFGIPAEKIEVRIHPVSVVHSLVEFIDGSFKAQLGRPDMRIPIQYALTYPDRMESDARSDDPQGWQPLEFLPLDPQRYPCLDAAYQALAKGGTAPAALNGVDEAAVGRFLGGEIPFGAIAECITKCVAQISPQPADSLDRVLAADRWGRKFAEDWNGRGRD